MSALQPLGPFQCTRDSKGLRFRVQDVGFRARGICIYIYIYIYICISLSIYIYICIGFRV